MATKRKTNDINLDDIMLEIGDSGLKRWGGILSEEFLPALQGQNAFRLYAEMRDNHPAIGAMLFAISSLVANVEWRIESPSDKPEDKDAADFVQSCLDDMTHTWEEFIQEALTMLPFGWAFHELVYKNRNGEDTEEEEDSSRYDDGQLGWKRLPLRAQETFSRWIFNDYGQPIAFEQLPPEGGARLIPMSKGLLFRTNANKGNPEGRSAIRNCVVPYLIQRRLQDIENIGIERDLAGLPVLEVPAKLLSRTADANERRLLTQMKTLLKNIRRDSQEGLLLPSDVDAKSGKALFNIRLLSTGGQRQIDTTAINDRWDKRILMTLLADFIMLGQGRSGSWALSSDKTELFVGAISNFLTKVTQTFNRNAIPRLLKNNGYKLKQTPILAHGDIETTNLGELGAFLTSLTSAGMPLFPDPALEDHVRKVGNLPKPSVDSSLRDAGEGSGGSEPTSEDPDKDMDPPSQPEPDEEKTPAVEE